MAAVPFLSFFKNLLGKTKYEAIRKSEPLQKQIDLTTAGLDAYRRDQAGSLAKYGSAIDAISGDVNRQAAEDTGVLGGLIQRGANYDPEQSYRNLGDYLTGLWGNAAGQIADIGRKNVNLGNAFTYGGRGGGSYGENVLLNNISRNLAPAFASTLSSITPAFQSVAGDRYRNIGSVSDLINQRAAVPFRGADLMLLPAEARTQMLGDEIAALQGIGGAVNTNLAGWKEDKNFWQKMGETGEETMDTVLDLAMQAASMYAGGGMGGAMGALGGMGGGMGGGKGGGGGGTQPTPPAQNVWWQQPQPNYSAPVTQAPNWAGQFSSIYGTPSPSGYGVPSPAPYGYGMSQYTYPGYANLWMPPRI